ncbi:amidohydrolase, partial [Litorivivens sp.]|uniref:amidohydrolase n=1 Tax=Litorivivens sp. TaxID=2020868 RepID=UPI003569CF4A
HGHFPGSGLTEFAADLNSPPIGDVKSIGSLQSRLSAFADANPDGWILGIGYDDSLLAEKRHPTREDLDAVSKDRPVYILHISGHMGVANSVALALAGIDNTTPDPEGGVIVRDSSGNATGLLKETAGTQLQTLAMDFSAIDFMEMIDSAAAEYLRVGVTTAQSGGVDSRMLSGLSLASKLRRIPQRLELWPIWQTVGEALVAGEMKLNPKPNDYLSIGAIKIIADGSIQGYTGYLSQPYFHPHHGDEDYRGFPVVPAQQLAEQVLAAHSAGYQLAIHGNGDAAIDMILDAIEKAQQAVPREDVRHIIVHAQMARHDQLARMKNLGVTPTFFSAHTYYWGDRHRDIFMGPERAARMSPARSAQALNLRYSIHLDTPVVPMNPMLLVWSAVNRVSASGAEIGPEEKVSVSDALAATTIDAAWQIHRDHELGSLTAGKLADLVVLDRNPLTVPALALRDIEVEQTYVGGRLYYQR